MDENILYNRKEVLTLDTEYAFEMNNICKAFAGVEALKDVSFKAHKGKVNVLIGENGAGKSTLMKILAGAIKKDSGEVIVEGNAVQITSPESALEHGVVMIYQELNLISNMTVADNIHLGVEQSKNGFINKKNVNRVTKQLIEEYELGIQPSDLVGELSMAKQQMIEIIKALSKKAKIIIMDEPTSSLTQQEVEQLFKIIEKLNNEGITIIYISHRMEEIFRIGHYITVMRDGRYIGDWKIKDINKDFLIKNMVGREITQMFPKEKVDIGDVVLSVKGLTKNKLYKNISFELHRGEILGMSGLVGAGRTEVALSIFGHLTPDSGEILINGEKANIKHPSHAIHKKIAYVPEDRKYMGLDLNSKIRNNISLSNMKAISQNGFIKPEKETKLCEKMVKDLRIKTPSILQKVGNLSGGNQQKVVIAKWISRDLDVLILDEPTRGVDVGAKEEIHRIVVELARKGMGIILISSELPEVMGMSDRIVVMHEGKVTGIINAAEATQEGLMSYATGVNNDINVVS